MPDLINIERKTPEEITMEFAKRDLLILRLEREFKDCVNELCYQCGSYKTEHLGSCDCCRWKKHRGGYVDE